MTIDIGVCSTPNAFIHHDAWKSSWNSVHHIYELNTEINLISTPIRNMDWHLVAWEYPFSSARLISEHLRPMGLTA
jgi:hypothetical protein